MKKESQRRTSAQIRKEKLKERLTVKMGLLRPARQGAGGRSHLGRHARTALSRSVVRQLAIIMNRQPCTIFHHSAEPSPLYVVRSDNSPPAYGDARVFNAPFSSYCRYSPPTILLNNMIFPICAVFEIGNDVRRTPSAIIRRIDCLKMPFSPQFARNIKILEYFEPCRIRRIKHQTIIIGKNRIPHRHPRTAIVECIYPFLRQSPVAYRKQQ